jgi:hypothetical protein
MANEASLSAVTTAFSSGSMLTLLAVAGAIVCWTVGEDWRQAMTPLNQQLKSASALAGRGSPQEIAALRRQAQDASQQRSAIEARLTSEGDLELVRAHLNSDLRRFCLNALAKNCVVRLADDSLANRVPGPGAVPPNPGAAAGANAASLSAAANTGAAGLESLGVLRARGTVSGVFEADEPTHLLQLMQQDSGRTWRVNGVVVKGNNFEIDLERLVLAPQTGAKP